MFINPKKIPNPRATFKGFTLVELLVVLAIIASLAAIAFPVTKSMLNKGKITETKMRMQEIEAAIDNYNSDNGHLPHAGGSYPSSETVSNTDFNDLVAILLNKETNSGEANVTGKKYLLMPDAKSKKNGIVYSNNDKSEVQYVVDAWGEEFEVLIDYDLDGEILKTIPGETNNSVKNKSVIIISKGTDGDTGNDDDIYSWK